MTSVFSSSLYFLSAFEDFADAPVNLHDDIAVKALLRFASELVAHVQRHVRHRVREVEEERSVLVALDELHRALGVLRR